MPTLLSQHSHYKLDRRLDLQKGSQEEVLERDCTGPISGRIDRRDLKISIKGFREKGKCSYFYMVLTIPTYSSLDLINLV